MRSGVAAFQNSQAVTTNKGNADKRGRVPAHITPLTLPFMFPLILHHAHR